MPPFASVDHSDELQADAVMPGDCASDSLEHGNPANMAQPLNPHSSRLEALPDELLMATFEQLVYDGPSWMKPAATLRAALRSLCVVSKRIEVIARPCLFKKVHIRSTVTLASLYHTIARSQHLGGKIKEIVVHIALDETEDERDFEELQEDCRQLGDEVVSEISDWTEKRCDLIGILCYELLSRAVNTRDLELCLPSWKHDLQRFMRYFDWVRDATRSTADGGAAVFLPRLKTLAVDSVVALESRTFVDLLNLPSLRTLRFESDDGDWWRLAPAAEPFNDWPHLDSECSPRMHTFPPP